jgi:hypothetical protein
MRPNWPNCLRLVKWSTEYRDSISLRIFHSPEELLHWTRNDTALSYSQTWIRPFGCSSNRGCGYYPLISLDQFRELILDGIMIEVTICRFFESFYNTKEHKVQCLKEIRSVNPEHDSYDLIFLRNFRIRSETWVPQESISKVAYCWINITSLLIFATYRRIIFVMSSMNKNSLMYGRKYRRITIASSARRLFDDNESWIRCTVMTSDVNESRATEIHTKRLKCLNLCKWNVEHLLHSRKRDNNYWVSHEILAST